MTKTIKISSIIFLLTVSSAFGQTMKIYTGNAVKQFVLSEIDSITFETGGETEPDLKKLKFENGEVSGWTEAEEQGYVEFTASDMYSLINGGAQEFIDKGMVKGFQQQMEKGDHMYRSYLMDFGTAENADAMFEAKAQDYASTIEVAGSYPDTTAFVQPNAYGYSGYAHFGRYMVVLMFDGYGNEKSQAKTDAVGFLQTIETKINAM